MKPISFRKEDGAVPEYLFDKLRTALCFVKNGQYELVIQKPKRNNDQNALFWMWMGLIYDSTGQSIREVYKFYCEKYNSQNCTYFKDGTFESGGTSKLNTKMFANFLNEIQADASTELGITLPDRESENFAEFYNQYSGYIR